MAQLSVLLCVLALQKKLFVAKWNQIVRTPSKQLQEQHELARTDNLSLSESTEEVAHRAPGPWDSGPASIRAHVFYLIDDDTSTRLKGQSRNAVISIDTGNRLV